MLESFMICFLSVFEKITYDFTRTDFRLGTYFNNLNNECDLYGIYLCK
jgi:hypothetical protein